MNRAKKIMIRISSGLLCLLTVITLTPSSFAQGSSPEKEETIYALLSQDGNVNSLYAVNSFQIENTGTVTDYGDYSSVRNLTTTDKIDYADGRASMKAAEGTFYYQGNMKSTQLPWTIGITYTLDQQPVSAENLAKKSGKITITISVSENTSVDPEYFDHYSLQISASLDESICKNILAPGATIASAGSKKAINFTHLTNTVKSYTISTDAQNFEMDPIQITGLILSMSIETSDLKSMSTGFDDLSVGIQKLSQGASSLQTGSRQFYSSLSAMSVNGKTLSTSADQIGKGLNQSSAGMSELLKNTQQLKALATALSASSDPQIQALAQGYLSQVTALEHISSGLSTLSGQYASFNTGISEYTGGVSAMLSGYGSIDSGINGLDQGLLKIKSSTGNLGSDVNAKIDEFLSPYTDSGYQPTSFVSTENGKITNLQFIMRTDGIAIPEPDKGQESPAPELSFWQRLLKLFGLYQE